MATARLEDLVGSIYTMARNPTADDYAAIMGLTGLHHLSFFSSYISFSRLYTSGKSKIC